MVQDLISMAKALTWTGVGVLIFGLLAVIVAWWAGIIDSLRPSSPYGLR